MATTTKKTTTTKPAAKKTTVAKLAANAEGNADLNQKLSEARAQAAVTFLVEHGGIDANRLEAVSFGSSKPKNADNPMAPENRRTEFEIIQ